VEIAEAKEKNVFVEPEMVLEEMFEPVVEASFVAYLHDKIINNQRRNVMKIAIAAQGDHLDAEVDSHFGRCAFFIIYDTETKAFKAIKNPNVTAQSGAGINSVTLIEREGVKKILAGNFGPKAERTLSSSDIEIVRDVAGTVKDAIQLVTK